MLGEILDAYGESQETLPANSIFSDADLNDAEVLDEFGVERDESDVDVTLLTVKERVKPNSVVVVGRTFRVAFEIHCSGLYWSMKERNHLCQEKFDKWKIDFYEAFSQLFRDDFDKLLDKIDRSVVEIHECGGITMILQRSGKEARIQLKAATLDEVCYSFLMVFNWYFICI